MFYCSVCIVIWVTEEDTTAKAGNYFIFVMPHAFLNFERANQVIVKQLSVIINKTHTHTFVPTILSYISTLGPFSLQFSARSVAHT